MTRAQLANEFTLINNDYNAIHALITRINNRNPQQILDQLSEGLKNNWDKFNAYTASKNEFDGERLQTFRNDLKIRLNKARDIANRYYTPPPPREITDINNKVYKKGNNN